jgi:predicted Rossmann fold nucleotide-binding protein DprA/Smf involved in DNA uptake
MSDVTPGTEEATAETTEATADATTDASSRRGRPRPDETITRDKQIFEHLDTGKTRAQLVEATGLTPNQVYLSLYRLNREGRIERARDGGAHVWTRVAAA